MSDHALVCTNAVARTSLRHATCAEYRDLVHRISSAFNHAPWSDRSREGVTYCSALMDLGLTNTAPEAWLFALALRRLHVVFGTKHELLVEISESIELGFVSKIPLRPSRLVPWLAAFLEVLPEERGYGEALADAHRCGVPLVHGLAVRTVLTWASYSFISEERRAALRAYLHAAKFSDHLLDALREQAAQKGHT